jgi:hypothetical protein
VDDFVLEAGILDNLVSEEVTVSNIDQELFVVDKHFGDECFAGREHPETRRSECQESKVCYEHTSDGDEQNFSMFCLEPFGAILVYDDDFDPCKCYGGVERDFHMQLISHPSPTNEQPCLDENHVYEQLEVAVTVVPEVDIFHSYILDEIIVLEIDHRYEGKPIFDEYSSDDEQQTIPMVCVEMINNQPTGGSEVTKQLFDPQMHVSVIQSGVPVEDIKQTVSGYDTMKVTFHKLIMCCLQFHDPVDEYIELYFSNSLEHAGLIFLAAFESNMGDHKNEISQLPHSPFFYGSLAVK